MSLAHTDVVIDFLLELDDFRRSLTFLEKSSPYELGLISGFFCYKVVGYSRMLSLPELLYSISTEPLKGHVKYIHVCIIAFPRNTLAFPRNTVTFTRNNIAFSRNIIPFSRNTYCVLSKYYCVLMK